MTHYRDRYLAHKAAGICTRCGRLPAVPGKVLCEQCREKAAQERQSPEYKEMQRLRSRERYIQGKATGICYRCHSRPVVPGKTLCDQCAPKVAQEMQRRKETRLMQGLCFYCGKEPVLPNKNYCSICQSYFQASYESRKDSYKEAILALKEQGICVSCKTGRVSGGHTICDACLAKGRERWQKRHLSSVQRAVMERDGFRCVLCGIESKLVVHHIDGQGHTRAETPDDSPSNLITLCSRCHACITHLTTQTDRSIAAYLILSARL